MSRVPEDKSGRVVPAPHLGGMNDRVVRLFRRSKGRARASWLAEGFPGAKGNGGDLDTAAVLLYRPLLRQPRSRHLSEGAEDHLPHGRRGRVRVHLNFIWCVIYFVLVVKASRIHGSILK